MEFNNHDGLEIDLDLDLDIGQIQQEKDEEDLALCADISDTFELISPSVSSIDEFPCVIIAGITTEAELDFFSKKGKDEIGNALPLYISFEGLHKKIGKFDLSLKNLLLVRTVANYEIWICKSESNKVQINLNDPEMLTKFISL